MSAPTPRVRSMFTPTVAATLVIVGVLANPLHEAGHWIGFALAGVPARISLDHTYFVERWAPSFAGAAGGPFMSIALAWLGAILWRRGGRLASTGLALALVMPLTRLVPYAIIALFAGVRMEVNDEGVMGLHCGWHPWTWAFVVMPLLVGAWGALWRSLSLSRARRGLLFGGVTIAWIAVAFVEVGVLEPRLFPDAEARELVMPGPPAARP